MNANRPETIKILRQSIERSIGRSMRTPRDFEYLRERIHQRLQIKVSQTTLKRIWEYVQGGEPRTTTLSHLTSFLGYASWEEFLKANTDDFDNPREAPSGYMLGRHIRVLDDLNPGDRMRLIWVPDRICNVRYLGDSRFEVESSEKTRLKPGDTFSCTFIMEGNPLYIDGLLQGDNEAVSYVCGARSGIRFERL